MFPTPSSQNVCPQPYSTTGLLKRKQSKQKYRIYLKFGSIKHILRMFRITHKKTTLHRFRTNINHLMPLIFKIKH
jgi:hypothetical protein